MINLKLALTRLSRRKKRDFLQAIETGCQEKVRLLLESGVSANTRTLFGETALIMAIQAGHAPIVGILLEFGANPNTEAVDGTTAFALAQHINNPQIIQLLDPHIQRGKQ